MAIFFLPIPFVFRSELYVQLQRTSTLTYRVVDIKIFVKIMNEYSSTQAEKQISNRSKQNKKQTNYEVYLLIFLPFAVSNVISTVYDACLIKFCKKNQCQFYQTILLSDTHK